MNVLRFVLITCVYFASVQHVFAQKKVSSSKDSLIQSQANSSVEEMVSEIGNIYFDSGSFELDKKDQFKLERLVKVLNNHPIFEILVVAHTDSKGTELYNQMLSEKRAEIVKFFLMKGEVSENRIYIETFGEKRPKNKCTDRVVCDESLHHENRRVEFVVFSD